MYHLLVSLDAVKFWQHPKNDKTKKGDPEILITRKKNYNCMVMEVNQTYGGEHFTTYSNIESLCGTPETNVMLYVNCISVKIVLDQFIQQLVHKV